jgi:uroporphyrinogen decarboxylase
MRFRPVDRPFRWETLGMWPETLDRWYAQGLDPSLKAARLDDKGAMARDEYLRVLVRGFGMDRFEDLRHAVASGYTDSPFCPRFDREVVAEEGDTQVVRDADGILKREFRRYGSSSMPQFLQYPVRSRSDFLDLLPRLDANHPARTSPQWAAIAAYYASRDFPLGLTVCGAFGHPRNLLGVEGLAVAYYDRPELVHEILEQWTEFYCRLTSRVWQAIQFDYLFIWEDMAYKNGPLISPRFVRTFMLPYYRRLIEHVRGLGCDVILVDSDGDVRSLAPLFLSVGVNAMLPFEVQAGMDVREFRRLYGQNLAIIGGLDKRALTGEPAGIRLELTDKLDFMLNTGGYIPCLDHTVPPNVSLAAFTEYVRQVRHHAKR